MASPSEAESTFFTLPACLDLKAAADLHREFLARRGLDLTVDAAEVSRLGGLCLQVLLAAEGAWRNDGREFAVVNASDTYSKALTLFGVAPGVGLRTEPLQ